MIVVVVMMRDPVAMRIVTVEKYRQLAVVGVEMGLVVAEVLRFDLVTERLSPYYERHTPLEAHLFSRQYCAVSLIFPHLVLRGRSHLSISRSWWFNSFAHIELF